MYAIVSSISYQMHKLCFVFIALLILPTRAVRVEDNSLKASPPSVYLRASVHFTEDRNDFTIFKTIAVSLLIHTINGSMYITGKGSVTLRHLNDCSHTTATTLDNVFYCKDLTYHLLLLGEFLQNGLSISGDRRIITVNKHNGTVFMTFKPKMSEDTIYVLQTIDWLSQQSVYLITVVDYDTIHCHLGHLFQEALRRMRKHVMDFPEVQIPLEDLICPGCTQGKMPNCCFSSSNHQAVHPFQLIHSDLKFFPVLSYYRQRYLITFHDNFISYAWVLMLTTKDKAI